MSPRAGKEGEDRHGSDARKDGSGTTCGAAEILFAAPAGVKVGEFSRLSQSQACLPGRLPTLALHYAPAPFSFSLLFPALSSTFWPKIPAYEGPESFLVCGILSLVWTAPYSQILSVALGSSVEATPAPGLAVENLEPRISVILRSELTLLSQGSREWRSVGEESSLLVRGGQGAQETLSAHSGPCKEGSVGKVSFYIMGCVMEACWRCSSWHYFCVPVRWCGDNAIHQATGEPGLHKQAWSQPLESWKSTGTEVASFAMAYKMLRPQKSNWLGNRKGNHKNTSKCLINCL